MSMPFWRSWIFLWALMPVFSAFFGMARYRFSHDTIAIQTHHTWGITFVFFTSAILFLMAPFFVLKRHIRGYGIGTHCLVILGTLIGWCIVFVITIKSSPVDVFFRFEREFSFAVVRAKQDASVLFGDILSLPWGKFLTQKVITTIVVFAAPIFTICVVAKRAGSFPITMLFVVFAAASVAVSDAFFDIIRSRSTGLDVLNGRAWSERLATIASWSVSSVIGASISAIGLGGLLERRDADGNEEHSPDRHIVATGLRLAAMTATILWGTSFSVQYSLRPDGFSSDFAKFRKSLTSPPEADISIGDNILTFSHLLEATTYRYPNSNYVSFQLSPDNRSAVVIEANGKNGSQLVAFDVASGERLASLSLPLTQHERVSFIWAKDQQQLIVRSRGKPIETGRYTRYETRIALFSLPDYEQVAQWEPTENICQSPEVSRNSMAEDNSGNLVVLCLAPSTEDDSRPLAVQLSLPLLDEVGIRASEDRETDSWADRLIAIGGSVYAPLIQRRGELGVVMANLISPELSVTLDDPYSTDRGGDLTFQDFVINEVADNTIGMRFCGGTDKVSNPPEVSTDAAWGPSFCRTIRFDLSDGSYGGHMDDAETRVSRANSRTREFSVTFAAWQFTGEVDPTSLTGEFRVSDAESGAIIQSLESSTQIPVVASEELRVLFTHRVDARQIAVYTIAQ
ncbi:MAG: hypothetical protein KUG62_08890 [Rhodobacteraceae bacterium]|nr:hypothetical protein [Paracoccaceae bacterium]